MGSCQNYGPFLGTLNNRFRIMIGTQKGVNHFDNHPHHFCPALTLGPPTYSNDSWHSHGTSPKPYSPKPYLEGQGT